jgi:hypothetical protein
MTVRTTSRTVTFTHPFNLSGMDEVQPAGTYTVETDEEPLQTLSVPAHRRIFNADAATGATRGYDADSDCRNKSSGTRRSPSEGRTAERNNTATDARRRCRASGKHYQPDGSHP